MSTSFLLALLALALPAGHTCSSSCVPAFMQLKIISPPSTRPLPFCNQVLGAREARGLSSLSMAGEFTDDKELKRRRLQRIAA
eukprot:311126-Rhodomonas_salina.1